MSQLQDNLNEILRQKNTYLLPENLKKNISLLGVDGTYVGDCEIFSTKAAMDADVNPYVGKKALIYGERETVLTDSSMFTGLRIVGHDGFTLDTPLSQDESYYCDFRVDGGGDSFVNISIQYNEANVEYMDWMHFDDRKQCRFTSEDGQHYVPAENNFSPETDWFFDNTFAKGSGTVTNIFSKFVKQLANSMEGLFEYTEDQTCIQFPNARTFTISGDTATIELLPNKYVLSSIKSYVPSTMIYNNETYSYPILYVDKNDNLALAYFKGGGFISNIVIDTSDNNKIIGFSGDVNSNFAAIICVLDPDTGVISSPSVAEVDLELVSSGIGTLLVDNPKSFAFAMSRGDNLITNWSGSFVDISALNVTIASGSVATSSLNNVYIIAKTQFTLNNPNQLYPGVVAMGNGKVVTGDGSIWNIIPADKRIQRLNLAQFEQGRYYVNPDKTYLCTNAVPTKRENGDLTYIKEKTNQDISNGDYDCVLFENAYSVDLTERGLLLDTNKTVFFDGSNIRDMATKEVLVALSASQYIIPDPFGTEFYYSKLTATSTFTVYKIDLDDYSNPVSFGSVVSPYTSRAYTISDLYFVWKGYDYTGRVGSGTVTKYIKVFDMTSKTFIEIGSDTRSYDADGQVYDIDDSSYIRSQNETLFCTGSYYGNTFYKIWKHIPGQSSATLICEKAPSTGTTYVELPKTSAIYKNGKYYDMIASSLSNPYTRETTITSTGMNTVGKGNVIKNGTIITDNTYDQYYYPQTTILDNNVVYCFRYAQNGNPEIISNITLTDDNLVSITTSGSLLSFEELHFSGIVNTGMTFNIFAYETSTDGITCFVRGSLYGKIKLRAFSVSTVNDFDMILSSANSSYNDDSNAIADSYAVLAVHPRYKLLGQQVAPAVDTTEEILGTNSNENSAEQSGGE